MSRASSPIELHYLGRTWRLGGAPDEPDEALATASGTVSVDFRGSLTALGTALIRAAHGRLDARPLIDDAWGDVLVPASVRAAYCDLAFAKFGAQPAMHANASPDALIDEFLGASRGYANVIMRMRYTEDALRDGIARGIGQYVIVGAGFDSFALRSPPYAKGVPVYEIDLPSMQALKRQRLLECGVPIPASLHWVAANLAEDDLGAALCDTPYDVRVPALFSWLGVTMFLTRDANVQTLRSMARVAAPGSELVFTYLDEAVFDALPESFQRMQAANRASGEPFQSGFNPRHLAEDLRDAGFELLDDLSDVELADRLAREATSCMKPLEFSRIARARVA